MPSFFRKIIRIKALDSPNVRLALTEIGAGRRPSYLTIVPGVLTYVEYLKRRATWDIVRQCIGLDAEFYEGGEVLLFPPLWLNRAEQIAESLRGRLRTAKSIGIDPGEGAENTAWAAIDEYGLIDMVSRLTPDTSVITSETIAFATKHGLKDNPENWVFDRGGGGKIGRAHV